MDEEPSALKLLWFKLSNIQENNLGLPTVIHIFFRNIDYVEHRYKVTLMLDIIIRHKEEGRKPTQPLLETKFELFGFQHPFSPKPHPSSCLSVYSCSSLDPMFTSDFFLFINSGIHW